MTQIVIATRNEHKYHEIKEILNDLPCEFLFAGDYPELPEIEENGETLLENAVIKAKETAKLLKMPCIADDTGFFVRGIDNRPGIYAARYAGDNCTYEDNVNKVLSEMEGIEDRYAYFSTVTAFFCPFDDYMGVGEGKVEGELIKTKKGSKGFGYDPIFIPAGYDKTYSEMNDSQKNKISHRYKSILDLKEKIINYIRSK